MDIERRAKSHRLAERFVRFEGKVTVRFLTLTLPRNPSPKTVAELH